MTDANLHEAKRKRRPAKRKLILARYHAYRKMGLSSKEAWTWAWKVENFAKDHWAPPKCGW
jgi:hypothetical protein